MHKALITGAAGSIGCHVVAHLLEKTDWDLVLIDSFRHMGLSERVTEVLRERLHAMADSGLGRLTVHTHDLTAPVSPLLRARLGEVHYIINLASMSDVFDSIENPVSFVQNNVAIALNTLELARALPRPHLKAFLQVSTDEVYGPTDGTFLHKEWDPIVPSSPYSASKAAQEAIAISYWRSYGVPLILVNLMNNFGEMQSPKKFPVIVQRKVANYDIVTIHGTPETQGSRFYIHSRNTADAFLHLLRNSPPHLHVDGEMDKPDRFNIPGDKQVSNLDLAYLIADELDRPLASKFEDFAATRPGHDRHYGLDGSKLAALGWKSPRTFEDTMRATVRWQKDHPEWLKSSS